MADTADALIDRILADRPTLPYRSNPADGLSGVTVDRAPNGNPLIDGLEHTPAAALELSAAIARAATPTTTTKETTP